MQLTSVLFAAAALLAPVYSNPIIPMGRRDAGLGVELASVANTKVSEPSTASAANSIIHRRGTVDVDTCTKDQKAEVDAAVKRAASLSTAAADAAVNGDARIFEYYFRTTDTATRQEVAARFEAIANETSSVGGGKVTYNCGNGLTQSDCGDALAYAVPSKNMVVNCPSWYIIVPETDDCGGKDQGLAMIHELTHLGDVYSPPATDIAYGYDAIVSLSKEDAIVNADTYLYYASAVDLGCQPGEGKGPDLPGWMVKEILKDQKHQ